MKRELHNWTYRVVACLAAILMVAGVGACQKGNTGPRGLTGQPGVPGEPGLPGEPAPIDTTLAMFEDLPGIVATVTDVSGGTGLAGQFQAGDTISVRFTLETGDGRALGVTDLDQANIWFTGPTFNYQRVIPNDGSFFLTDVKDAATINTDGSYTYNFPAPIPATYGPPLNDSGSYTLDELTGVSLLDGTYTVSIAFGKEYYVGSDLYLDSANVVENVLVGSATTIEPREVVGNDNCNACHVSVRAHALEEGNLNTLMFRDTAMCVTCHTTGAEDNDQKASIDFRVMIHKIHNGEHLPSVNGVTTKSDGTRDYAATPVPYLVGDRDFSFVSFPVWPNFNISMPRDAGFSSLSNSSPVVISASGSTLNGPQGQENQILRGVTNCAKCHGDGGNGSVTAPAQGDLAYYQQSRRSCGSCHDDIKWDDPGKPGAVNYKYISNYGPGGMPAQTSDSSCISCHSATFDSAALPNDSIAVRNAHLFPILNTRAVNPTNYFNPGINVNVTSVSEAGTNNGDGTIDPGEKIALTFTVKDDGGSDVSITNTNVFMNWRSNISVIISGPTNNLNQVNYASIPVPALVGLTSPYTVNFPDPITYEYLGDSTASATDGFTTDNKPVWAVAAGASPTAVALTGTAQSGTVSGIKLCQTVAAPPTAACTVAASSTDETYTGNWVWITGGTGSGQVRLITSYTGSTRTANVSPNWGTAPDNTSAYAVGAAVIPNVYVRTDYTPTIPQAVVYADIAAREAYVDVDISGMAETGTAQAGCGGSCKTITLAAGASGTDNYYRDMSIAITGGTGKGQTLVITGYVGATKVATVKSNWATGKNPDATSVYRIQPFGTSDDIVLDDGNGEEEYVRITGLIVPAPGQTDNNIQRLIIGSSYRATTTNQTRWLRNAHDAGATVIKVNMGLPKKYGTDYTVDGPNGTVTEVGDSFGTGKAVVISYTTDFVMPATYPPPFFDTPNMSSDDIETWGAWKNKSIVSGTYIVGVWTVMAQALNLYGQTSSYTEASPPMNTLVKVGSATTLEPYDKIESGETCLACHNTIRFHGANRRDFDTCITCHGTAGLAVNQTSVPGESANFRTFLHWAHAEDAESKVIEDDGEVFPAQPGGVASCTKCHGDATAWQEPVSRDHPTEQGAPTRVWRATCEACHESSAAEAHIDIQTSEEGVESCAVCHGDGAEYDVKLVHKRQ